VITLSIEKHKGLYTPNFPINNRRWNPITNEWQDNDRPSEKPKLGKLEYSLHLQRKDITVGDWVVYSGCVQLTENNIFKVVYVEEMHHLCNDYDHDNNPKAYIIKPVHGSPFKSSCSFHRKVAESEVPQEIKDKFK
jgi:hypothetical protein